MLEFMSMAKTNTFTELCLVGIVILIFVFGYYAGRMKESAECEKIIEELSDKQVDPVLAELAMIKLQEFAEHGKSHSWEKNQF